MHYKNYLKKAPLCLFPLLLIWSCNQSTDELGNFINPGSLPILKNGKMSQVSSYDTTGDNNDRINIPVNETAIIADLKGTGVITRIWFTIDSRDPFFLRRTLIRMYWDDEENPSIEVPLGDFFGTGFEYKHYFSQYLGMTSGGYFCYFPMPFRKSARIEIVNQTGEEIYAFYYQINVFYPEKPFKKNMAYFHAFWNRDIKTDKPENYTILEAEGKGHVVGLNMNMQSYNGSLGYLEGDEMVWVDGEKKPSIVGTGTEDYFTSGWYFKDGEFHAPYHGLILKDEKNGRIAAYRLHIPDPIPFQKSIKFTMEHGHANESIADYSSTVYWYQKEPHKKFSAIKKASMRIPLRTIIPPGGIEAENLIPASNPSFLVEDMTDFGPEWSNGKQLRVKQTRGFQFELSLSNLEEAQYDIDLYYTKGPDYGKVKVFQDTRLLAKFNGQNKKMLPGEKCELKNLKTSENKIKLTFVSVDKNENVGLDVFNLHPKRNYIPEWMIVGPFVNKRDSDILRYGIDSVYPPERQVNLQAEYNGINGQTIHWTRYKTPENGYFSLWDKVNPYEFVISYAFTLVYSPMDQTVPFFIGSDDGSKVFLNGKEYYRFLDIRVAAPDQDIIQLPLKKGWNELLLKLENNFGGYAFYARIRDKNGSLKYSIQKD